MALKKRIKEMAKKKPKQEMDCEDNLDKQGKKTYNTPEKK